MKRLVLAYALLCPSVLHADTAVVHVTATIASFASVEVEDNYARVVTNDPDALAWANGITLTGEWVCVLDCDADDVRWAAR